MESDGVTVSPGRGGEAGEAAAAPDPGAPGPFGAAVLQVALPNPQTGSRLRTDIYYPLAGSEPAPCPAVVFAHGLAAQPGHYSGWGEHLASWGYVAAIPHLPNEHLEVRFKDVEFVLGYLEAENAAPASALAGRIDGDQLGVVGHSTGGITAMMAGARALRVRAVVALDPADPYAAEHVVAAWLRARGALAPRMTRGLALAGRRVFRRVARLSGNAWDFKAEARNVHAPLMVIGGRPEACNVWAYYRAVYAAAGPAHKALYVLPDGRHCDYLDTPDVRARDSGYLVCQPRGRFSPDRLARIKRHATAWLNYYLAGQAADFTYVYGERVQAEARAGLIEVRAMTAPRDVTAVGQPAAVRLSWTAAGYPVIAGYNVYRQEGALPVEGARADAPREGAVAANVRLLRAVGPCAGYVDGAVVPGRTYAYTLRSRDAAGNEHQAAPEVWAQRLA